VIGEASFHCGRDAQRLMDTGEIVIGMIDGVHAAVVIELL
jgi:hypothetical protein